MPLILGSHFLNSSVRIPRPRARHSRAGGNLNAACPTVNSYRISGEMPGEKFKKEWNLSKTVMVEYGGTVYIVSNLAHTVLYIGVASNLMSRVRQHREKIYSTSFTARYNCRKLVYFENFGRIEEAIAREKQLKKWKRSWKMNLISSLNPRWADLFDELE